MVMAMQKSANFEELKQQSEGQLSFKLGRWQTYCFAKLLNVPGMPSLCKNTFLGATHYTNELVRKNKSHQALQHLMQLLKSKKFIEGPTYRWWYLMRQAVMLAQDYQLCSQNHFKGEIKHLMSLGTNGPLCSSGYDVAFCFVGFGLWAFQMGDTKLAIRYIQHAIDADNTWGYPDYLMGWLGLFDKQVDTVHHFVKALKYNWSFFHRINRDPICQKHPEILKEVRQKVLHLNKQGASIGPNAR